jgi:hypothetical protein
LPHIDGWISYKLSTNDEFIGNDLRGFLLAWTSPFAFRPIKFEVNHNHFVTRSNHSAEIPHCVGNLSQLFKGGERGKINFDKKFHCGMRGQ